MFNKIDHLGIVVENPDELEVKYKDFFAFKEFGRFERPEVNTKGIILENDKGIKIELLSKINKDEEIGIKDHIGILVDDLEKIYNDLKNKGLAFNSAPIKGITCKAVAFFELGGKLFELIER